MLCKVCKEGLEGIWDPSRSSRLALLKDYFENEDEDDGGGNEADNTHGSGATGKCEQPF